MGEALPRPVHVWWKKRGRRISCHVWQSPQKRLHRAFLAHAVGAADTLLQDHPDPGQINIDNGVGGLKIQTRDAALVRDKKACSPDSPETAARNPGAASAARSHPTGHSSASGLPAAARSCSASRSTRRRGQPCGLVGSLLQKRIKLLQLARVPWRCLFTRNVLFAKPARQQRLLKPQEIHFRNIFLLEDDLNDPAMGAFQSELLVGRRNASDLRGLGRGRSLMTDARVRRSRMGFNRSRRSSRFLYPRSFPFHRPSDAG